MYSLFNAIMVENNINIGKSCSKILKIDIFESNSYLENLPIKDFWVKILFFLTFLIFELYFTVLVK